MALLAQGERPSLRQVARAAGVSPAAPYHHFHSANGLMAAVACAGFTALEEALLATLDRTEKTAEQAPNMSATYVTFALAHPEHYRLMFDPELEPADDALERVAQRVFGHLVGAVARALPEAPRVVVQMRARQIFALAHGCIDLATAGALAKLEGPHAPRGVAEEVAAATTILLRAPSSSRRPNPE